MAIIGGFIAGVEFGSIADHSFGITTHDFNFWYALPYWVGSFVSGMVFIAFGEVVKLLTQIRNNLALKEDENADSKKN